MTDQEREAIASIALLAAFADGANQDSEREEVRRVAQALDGDLPMAALHRDVLLRKTTVETASAQLSTRDLKLLAYEFAVGVAESDGLRNPLETAFLARLAKALGLDERVTGPVHEHADALAAASLDPNEAGAAQVGATTASRSPASASESVPGAQVADPALAQADDAVDPEDQAAAEVAGGKIFIGTADSSTPAISTKAVNASTSGSGAADSSGSEDAGIDRVIVNAAIMNGALELLPQSLASMAIIPLQMKLVYGIGKRYGYELDRGHVKDLLATMGAGVTGQYIEGVGRKLLGGLFGKAAGGMIGGLAKGATGMALSFATTWAIGQVARRYYAGGRTMSAEMLKETFAALMDEARSLQARHAPQIEQQAKSIDPGKLLDLVRSR